LVQDAMVEVKMVLEGFRATCASIFLSMKQTTCEMSINWPRPRLTAFEQRITICKVT